MNVDDPTVSFPHPRYGECSPDNGVEAAIMPILAESPGRAGRPNARRRDRKYRAPMTITANDVAAALRDQIPGIHARKLHALLYLCQGHHLAANNTPLFQDGVAAAADGVLVDNVDTTAGKTLGDVPLATIGLVVSRYGRLTGLDLTTLVTAQTPWQHAVRAGASGVLEQQWIRDYFVAAENHRDGTSTGFPRSVRPTTDVDRARPASTPDSPADIEAFIAEVRART
jgi:uncharacterized phage-associated protein